MQNHRSNFSFPSRPFVSSRCQHLIACLVQEKETRLCSRRYQFRDAQQRTYQSPSIRASKANQPEFASRFVFPYDAEDIKAHKWFKGVPWEKLHELDPPFVPMIRSPDDTQYFDEEEPVTDLSESEDEEDLVLPPSELPSCPTNLDTAIGRDGADDLGLNCATPREVNSDPSSASTVNHVQQPVSPDSEQPLLVASCKHDTQGAITSDAATLKVPNVQPSNKRAGREAHLAEVLRPFDRSIQDAVRSWLAVPYDSLRLRNFELQVDIEPGLRSSQRDTLKALARVYGRKEKKRPRDRLLRDPSTKRAVLEERKKTAFLGYDWRRGQALPLAAMMMVPGSIRSVSLGQTPCLPPPSVLPMNATMGSGFVVRPEEYCQGGGGWACFPPGHEHLAALRALHRGRMSMN